MPLELPNELFWLLLIIPKFGKESGVDIKVSKLNLGKLGKLRASDTWFGETSMDIFIF